MILVALFIGVVLIVAAIRNSQAALFNALGQDVPGYIVWAAALFAVGSIGYIPGLKPVSRGLLALVLFVIILNNYSTILSGFQAVASSSSGSTGSGSGTGSTVSTANSSGTVSTSSNATSSNATTNSNPYLGNNDQPSVLLALLGNQADPTAGFGGSSVSDDTTAAIGS